jgi:opacity protein-like surface antigen
MTRKPSLRQTVSVGVRAVPIAPQPGKGIWTLAAAVLAISVSLPVHAAGPKAGQIYAGFGGGLFTPEFNLEDSGQASVGPTVQRQNIAIPRISIGPIGFRLPVDIIAGDTRVQQSDDPENRGVLSLNGGVGYQFTDHLGVEGGLGLTLPRILLEGALVSRVISNDPESITIKIAAPAIIPINLSAIYTFIPDNIVSPFVGVGVLFADLSNRISFNEASDTIGAEGGFEVGYVLDAGARFRVNDQWFGTVGVRYGQIDSPELEDDYGNQIAIEDLEIREIRFGMGLAFPGSILPFLAGGS